MNDRWTESLIKGKNWHTLENQLFWNKKGKGNVTNNPVLGPVRLRAQRRIVEGSLIQWCTKQAGETQETQSIYFDETGQRTEQDMEYTYTYKIS